MKYLYRTYQLLIALPIGLVLTLLTALLTIIGSPFNAHFWGYWPPKLWSRAVVRLLLLPVRVRGRDKINPHQSYIFVANHQGPLDIFLVYGFLGRNFKWMMKKSLRRIPFVGFACYRAGHIFVDKSGPSKVKETYDRARATLQGGTSLVVFPEGSRTFTGHMARFRKGAFALADELQLPVVPMTINGSFDALPRQAGFNFVRRCRLELVIHDPIPPTPASADQGDHLKPTMQCAYQTIMAALPSQYQGFRENLDQ